MLSTKEFTTWNVGCPPESVKKLSLCLAQDMNGMCAVCLYNGVGAQVKRYTVYTLCSVDVNTNSSSLEIHFFYQ